MSGMPMAQAWHAGAVGTVLRETHFGNVCVARLAVAIVVARRLRRGRCGGIAASRARSARWARSRSSRASRCAATRRRAAAPRARSASARTRCISLAAGAWLGALVPFAALLTRGANGGPDLVLVHRAARRFSTLGIASVAVIVFTGIINTRYTVGTLDALIGSRYGMELLVKVAIFLAILAVAAVNRWRLTPRVATTVAGPAALRALR